MIRSASARTGRRISRSSTSPPCGRSRICWCFVPPTPSRRREAWELRACARQVAFGAVLCPGRRCRRCGPHVARENPVAPSARYVLHQPKGKRDVTLIATGSEVSHRGRGGRCGSASEGIRAAVVSAPCFELFEPQPADYRRSVLGTAPRVGIEAARRGPWRTWIGETGRLRRHDRLRGIGAGRRTLSRIRHHASRRCAACRRASGRRDARSAIPIPA